MANISDFKIAMRSGPLRQNRWELQFNFPNGVSSNDVSRNGSILARTADVPDSTLGEILIPWRGKDFPYPGDRAVSEYPVTFIAVQDMKLHGGFMQWKNDLVGFEDNIQHKDFAELVTDITMILLNVKDEPVAKYKLEDAWPREVSAMTGDMGAKDSHQEFTVTFRYLTPKLLAT